MIQLAPRAQGRTRVAQGLTRALLSVVAAVTLALAVAQVAWAAGLTVSIDSYGTPTEDLLLGSKFKQRTVNLLVEGTGLSSSNPPKYSTSYEDETGDTQTLIDQPVENWSVSGGGTKGSCTVVFTEPGKYGTLNALFLWIGEDGGSTSLTPFTIAGAPSVDKILFKKDAAATDYLMKPNDDTKELDLAPQLYSEDKTCAAAEVIEVRLKADELDLANSKVQLLTGANVEQVSAKASFVWDPAEEVYVATLDQLKDDPAKPLDEGVAAIKIEAKDLYGHALVTNNDRGYTLYGGKVIQNGEEYFAVTDGRFVIDRTDPTGYVRLDLITSVADKMYVKPVADVTVGNAERNLDQVTQTTAHVVRTDDVTLDFPVEWGTADANGMHGSFVLPKGTYKEITVDLRDLAGNKGQATVTSSFAGKTLYVDGDAPEVSLSFVDAPGAVATTKDGVTYVSGIRSYLVKVLESNFYTGGMGSHVTVENAQDGYAGPTTNIQVNSKWTHIDDSEHNLEPIAFDTDGQFVLSVDAKDVPGNEAATVSTDPFVIDTEAPQLAVAANAAAAADENFGAGGQAVQLQAGGNEFDGVTYYAHAIKFYPRVKDRNFDEAATTVGLSKDGTETMQVVSWDKLTSDRDADGYLVWQTKEPVVASDDGSYTTPHLVSCDLTGDTAHNKADNAAGLKHFVIDLDAPVVKVDVDQSPSNQGDPDAAGDSINFYNLPTTMTFTVTDAHGLKSVSVVDPDGLYDVTASDAEGALSTTVTLTLKDGTEEHDAIFDRDIKLTATDLAGNIRVWTLDHKGTVTRNLEITPDDNAAINDGGTHPLALILDTVAPELALEGVEAGVFYSAGQTATATVTEYNFLYLQLFAGSRTVVTVTKHEANADRTESSWTVPVSAFAGTRPTYQATQDFTSDGHYELAAQLTDIAGNVSALASIGEFTVDTTPPELSVSFANASGAQESTTDGVIYVSGDRTATITVVEHNFDPTLMSVEIPTANAPEGYSGPTYDPTAWTDDGDTHTYTVSFDTDGEYTLNVSGKDLAGNVAVQADGTEGYQSPTFVVDSEPPVVADYYESGTAPEETFDSGDPVAELPAPTEVYNATSYYNHAIHLDVKVKDRNFSADNTQVWMRKDGTQTEQSVTWGSPRGRGSNGYEFWQTNLAFDSDGVYETPRVKSTDLAGNTTDKTDGKSFVVDLVAPTLKVNVSNAPVSQGTDGNQDGPTNFYNVATTMTFTVGDNHALNTVVIDDPDNAYDVSAAGSAKGATSTKLTVQLKDGTLAADNKYDRPITLTATDIAGNVRTWTIAKSGEVTEGETTKQVTNPSLDDKGEYPFELVQDTVAPVVGLTGVTEGSFYNSAQTVVATVSELNFDYLQRFDGARPVVTVTKYEGNAGRALSSWTIPATSFTGTKPNYSFNQVFDSDGHYVVTAQFRDFAENLSNEVVIGEFTIDMTPPQVTLEFDNNDVRNEKYYKATRTATITVVEHNFDESLFTVETTGTMGGWTHNGDTHVLTVFFDEGGPYTITVNGKDQAGNEANEVSEPEFVVDLTAPEITIAGTGQRLGYVGEGGQIVGAYHDTLEDVSAYNGVVVPQIIYSDNEPLAADELSHSLAGSKHGDDVEHEASYPMPDEAQGDKQLTVTLADLGYEGPNTADGSNWENFYVDDYAPDADDIYTLKASLTDQAGNEAEAQITFSVNRYGSNYEVRLDGVESDEMEEYERSGVLSEAPTVLVREVNVSGVADRDKDGNFVPDHHHVEKEFANATKAIAYTEAAEGAGYEIESVTGEDQANGWSEYRYTVRAANFGEGSDSDHNDRGQGVYRVNVMSDDTSSNANTTAGYWRSDDRRAKVEAAGATAEFVLDELGPSIDELDLPEHLSAGASYEASFHITDDITAGNSVEVVVDGVTLRASEVHGPGNGVGTYSFTIPAKAFNWGRSVQIMVRDYAGREATARNNNWIWQSTFVPEGLVAAAVLAVGVTGVVVSRKRRDAAEPELPLQ